MRSVQVATRKRPVDIDNLEQMVSGIVRQLENRGDTIISSELIGTLIMEECDKLMTYPMSDLHLFTKIFVKQRTLKSFLRKSQIPISKFGLSLKL